MYEYRGKHSSSAQWTVSSSSSRGYRPRHEMKTHHKRTGLIIVVILVVILAVPFITPLFPQTDRAVLTSEDLPYDIGRMRLVYITDIHYGFFYSDGRLNSLVNTINNLKPDLVLFGGDYAVDNDSAIRFFQRLPSIHARYQMLGVVGETDRGDSDLDLSLLTDAMKNAGITPLVNSVSQVRFGNSSIYVAGADDVTKGKPDVASLAAGVSSDDYVIFMAHNPSLLPEAQGATDSSGRLGWFDLALFGHTHGGQIGFLSSLFDIGGDVDERYRAGGWRQENRVDILISNGVGTSKIPARISCPAQIHCIDISVP